MPASSSNTKLLTDLAILELGIDKMFAGRIWAFVPVADGTYAQWSLGIAVANETGHNPIPPFWAHSDDYNVLSDHADELNLKRGLSVEVAAKIAASTMRQPGRIPELARTLAHALIARNVEPEALDELVHDVAGAKDADAANREDDEEAQENAIDIESGKASEINSDGLERQILSILEGFGLAEGERLINEAADEWLTASSHYKIRASA
jgi:hypothetical protein